MTEVAWDLGATSPIQRRDEAGVEREIDLK